MLASAQFLFNTFTLNLGKFSIPVSYWQALTILLLVFVLIFTIAQMRRHYIDWSLKGGIAGIFFGFLLALILEGFLLLGGRTVLTELLGWENAPKPISLALDAGKNKLMGVLGAQTQIPSTYAKEKEDFQSTLMSIQNLNPSDLNKVKSILCK